MCSKYCRSLIVYKISWASGHFTSRPHTTHNRSITVIISYQQSLGAMVLSETDNNNNLRLIRLRQTTQPYTEQSATQGKNNTMTQLSRRTATTRFSPEGCQKQTAPRCCQHPIRWAFYLTSTHQMAPPGTHPENRPATHLSTPERWKAKLA